MFRITFPFTLAIALSACGPRYESNPRYIPQGAQTVPASQTLHPVSDEASMTDAEISQTLHLAKLIYVCQQLQLGVENWWKPISLGSRIPSQEEFERMLQAHDYVWTELGVPLQYFDSFTVDGKHVTRWNVSSDEEWERLQDSEPTKTIAPQGFQIAYNLICKSALLESGTHDPDLIQANISTQKSKIRRLKQQVRQSLQE